jgi:thiamine biosynthesis protein ThiC
MMHRLTNPKFTDIVTCMFREQNEICRLTVLEHCKNFDVKLSVMHSIRCGSEASATDSLKNLHKFDFNVAIL